MIPVLFVDDEMIVRVALKSMVDWEKTEFKIVGAVSDGETALQYIEKYHPQIIVTDLKMPHLDGIGLAKELYERGYQGKMIILSSFGEFELAREALRYGVTDYLLKANFTDKELLEALRKAAKKLPPEPFVTKKTEEMKSEFDQSKINGMLYGGNKEDSTESPEFNKTYSTEFVGVYVFKREILLSGRSRTVRKEEPDMTSKEMLSSLISETFDAGFKMEAIPLTPMDALIVLPLPSDKPVQEILEKYLSRIQNSVKIYMNTEAGFVLSEPFSSELQLSANLKSCAQAAAISLYKGFGNLIHQQDILFYSKEIADDQYDAIELICAGMAFHEYESAKILAIAILESFDKQGIDPVCACDYIHKLFKNMMLFSSGCFEGNENKIKELAAGCRECGTVYEYEAAMKDLIHAVSENAGKNQAVKYRKDVMRIIEYIKKNITQKITLAQIAKLVHMNESYISRLFKNETGVNITSYINLLKMGQAIELLKDPNVMVKEVANKLGFDEQSYFNRIFNKYLSSSPSEFKKKYKKSIKIDQNNINGTAR